MSPPYTIPKRTFQTARTHNLSTIEQAARVNIELLHPGWDHRFYDDAAIRDFIRNEFPQYQSIFDSFPRIIQKIDFFRYLAVYRFGGFYFDLDVFLCREISALCSSGCVFPFEELSLSQHLRQTHHMDWEIGNYAFGAAAGHPFLKAVIENCVRAQVDPAWVRPMMHGIPKMFSGELMVLNTTGPGLLSRTLAENGEIAKTVTILFPDDVREAKAWHHFGGFGVHQMAASWRDKGSFLKRKLALFWEARLRQNQMIESQALGPARMHPPGKPASG